MPCFVLGFFSFIMEYKSSRPKKKKEKGKEKKHRHTLYDHLLLVHCLTVSRVHELQKNKPFSWSI